MLVALIVLGVLAVQAVIQQVYVRRDQRRFPPPGTLVNGLHVLKMGEGRPAVVFESGLANSSLSWSLIQPQVAKFATAYAYDRAGFGWSHISKGLCSLEEITADLHAMLGQLQVPRPFILVGHSFGGLIARYYAHCFPGEVAGLVLVDPATPEEWMDPDQRQRWRLRRAVFFTRAAGVLASIGLVRLGLWLLLRRKQDAPGPVSRFSRTLRRIRFEVKKIPPEVLPCVQAHWSRASFYWAMARYLKALPACANLVSNCLTPDNIPVSVLSGAHQPPDRLGEHAAIATLHTIAQSSGHFIHLDEPDLVAEAIRGVLHKQGAEQELR